MPNTKGIRAGRAFVELFALRRAQDQADDSKLVRGLKAARANLHAFGAAVSGIGMKVFAAGGAMAAPLAGAAAVFSRAGDEGRLTAKSGSQRHTAVCSGVAWDRLV